MNEKSDRAFPGAQARRYNSSHDYDSSAFTISASALAGPAATLAFPTSARTAPVTTYKPGRYDLIVEDVYAVAPQSTVDLNDRCVEPFGILTITQGNNSYSHFQSP
ncbi:hypothetical protein AB0901_00380 [Streptomyces roseifaciens]